MNGATAHAFGARATLGWGLAIGLAYLGAQLGFAAWFVAEGATTRAELLARVARVTEDGTVLARVVLLANALGLALLVAVLRLRRASLVDSLALRPVPARTYATWLLAFVGFGLLASLLVAWLDRPVMPDWMFRTYASADPAWPFWLAVVVAAPLFEEAFFRGFLYRGLAASPLGPAGAILLTSAVFAGIHLQYDALGMGLVFGFAVLLGIARWRTGSLLVPLGLHALANLLATAQVAALA